ncbi:MAG: ATPase [Alcanivorax borkumensis]|uniref:histidine kinase n=1 Tax=Alcanivorax borkumensis (strain ATCC 700651 / DSM 11573 / NCIMB 13689 / SK2) TaxID=393595 RepID=Q0VSF8_ALCBS|nr:hybrid sensor histidine kinase/response regulator [Alcanivorax borkumensis]OJH06849.1 MAG: ATPase [Alcanivorax borkumensis]CAL15890.1 sensor histidine kinase [Alcanivorax borkumensis SK2]
MTQGLLIFKQGIATVFLLMLAISGHSLTLSDEQDSYQAAHGMQWLAGPKQAYSPEMALQAFLDDQGEKIHDKYPSLGFRKGLQWFLIPIENQSGQSLWFARMGRPHLDYLDIYLFDQQGKRLWHNRLGDRVPFHTRAFAHSHLVSTLNLPINTRRYLLLRAQGDNVIDLPVSVMSATAFNQQDTQVTIFYGLYFGAMVAIFLFNLLIFISIRDRSYLLYVLYLGTFTLNIFTREGLSYQWLWPQATQWNHYSIPILNLLTLAFSILFTCQFLELKKRAPTINRGLVATASVLILFAPLTLIDFHFFIQASTAIILPWLLVAIALSIWLIRQGYSPARYFLLAFTAVALATMAYILKTFQLINGGWLLENIMPMGTFIEALLLSFALAHRMTILKSENARIQNEANEILEQRVSERTSELNAALNARSEFLAVMSHEIRTPLNGIIGTVDMLKGSPLNDEQRHNLNVIEQSGNSLLNLINDILDYSRIEAGKMPIEQTSFNLFNLLNESLTLFQHKAQIHSNALTLDVAPNVSERCLGDPVRLRQILVNLISNAVKFTDNGTITVRAQRDPANSDYLYFEVQDSGTGISEEQQRRLFDHFQQGDSSTSRRYGGTGLGLAICRQLVEIMGGEIGVDSKPKQGSRFWFRLPIPCTERADTCTTAPAIDNQSVLFEGRLLIVDDNHINLMVAEGLCQKLGYETEVAESGLEAIAVLMSTTQPFDLILMDCEMPDMDGFETSRAIIKLQQENRLPWVPIIALTAHAIPDKIRACRDAGMIGHLAKPVNLARLQTTLRQALRSTGPRPSKARNHSDSQR